MSSSLPNKFEINNLPELDASMSQLYSLISNLIRNNFDSQFVEFLESQLKSNSTIDESLIINSGLLDCFNSVIETSETNVIKNYFYILGLLLEKSKNNSYFDFLVQNLGYITMHLFDKDMSAYITNLLKNICALSKKSKTIADVLIEKYDILEKLSEFLSLDNKKANNYDTLILDIIYILINCNKKYLLGSNKLFILKLKESFNFNSNILLDILKSFVYFQVNWYDGEMHDILYDSITITTVCSLFNEIVVDINKNKDIIHYILLFLKNIIRLRPFNNDNIFSNIMDTILSKYNSLTIFQSEIIELVLFSVDNYDYAKEFFTKNYVFIKYLLSSYHQLNFNSKANIFRIYYKVFMYNHKKNIIFDLCIKEAFLVLHEIIELSEIFSNSYIIDFISIIYKHFPEYTHLINKEKIISSLSNSNDDQDDTLKTLIQISNDSEDDYDDTMF